MTFCTPGRTIGTPVRVISERRRPIRGDDPEKRQGRVTAVDAYPEGASPYGVMDMVGNLSEWTALRDDNQIGSMGYSAKQISEGFEWFWGLSMHYQSSTRIQPDRYVCFRPVLHEWGRRLWPGYRRGLG